MNGSNAFQSSFSYFIIAGMATQASQAIREMGGAAIKTSAELGRSFADVDRTFDGTSAQLDSLKAKLFELSTTTPINFADLSQIAALGNQLGIASQDIESFTTTISQYSAISGQTAEESATAFGKISNLTGLAASQYSNLASSIEFVARTSVATEATISKTATEITALASGAGFSAQAIVGLSGALSSLSIPPERARGALSLYFGALNGAVAEGGPKMAAFATLTGKTADQLGRMVRENKGQEVFTAFISGLSKLDSVAKTSALDTLGLSTIRVDQTMRALSQNVPLLTQSFAGADDAFKKNTELSRQYAIIQETLDSKIKEFQNSMQNAAGAAGDTLGPALTDVLAIATDLMTQFSAFSQTEFGRTFLQMAGGAAILVAVLASVIGALALAKAGIVIFSFAMSGLGWDSASKGFRGLIAGLFASDVETRKAARSMTGLKVAMAETSLSAVGLRLATLALNAVFGLLVLGVVVQAFSKIDHAVNSTKYAIEGLGGSTDELLKAMQTDNPQLFATKVSETGVASDAASGGVGTLNSAILSAIQTQEDAAAAVGGTNNKIDEQSVKLGDATNAWLRNAVLQSQAMKEIFDTSDGGLLGKFIGDSSKNNRNALEYALKNGFDLDKFSKTVYTQGQDAGVKLYEGWVAGVNRKALKGDKKAIDIGMNLVGDTGSLESEFIKPLAEGVSGAKLQALIANGIAGTTEKAKEGTLAVNEYGQAMSGVTPEAIALGDGFLGASSSLSAFQDNMQSGIGDFVDFKNVLKTVADAQKAANDNPKRGGKDGTSTALMNANVFDSELKKANTSAVDFFNGLSTVAQSGATSFATQIAKLGPDAKEVLASAAKLSPAQLAELEADSRFAAFLASDAFKNAFNSGMGDSSLAYARIFKTTGNLADVRSYIAAQVAGTGKVWEQEWDKNHPDAPLNLTMVNPTQSELDTWGKQLSGQITVTPNINFDPKGLTPHGRNANTNIYTDTTTGNSIVLPATLSKSALDASLAIWNEDQKLDPRQIAAKINAQTLNADLANWVAQHGKIQIETTLNVTAPNLNKILAGIRDASGRPINHGQFARGGEVDVPHFASGGAWGQFQGPGTGTSDNIWARVSAGEFINTADATNFWGPDFFDSLNRKMLPTSFLNLLGAAAASGNQGPSHVAHVQLVQNYPLTRDPLKKLREDSEMLVSGIWG
jgi:phage tail tape measure protein, TP901 family, core region